MNFKKEYRCSKKWSQLNWKDQKKFCNECQKNVFLFGYKSKPIKKNRFCAFILEKPAENSSSHLSRVLFLTKVISFFPFLTLLLAKAGVSQSITATPYTEADTLLKSTAQIPFTFKKRMVVKGTVRDRETGEVLPFVNITLHHRKNMLDGTMTDLNGQFNMILDSNYVDKEDLNIKINYVGYREEIINNISFKHDTLQLNINLKDVSEDFFLGIIVIENGGSNSVDPWNTSSGTTFNREDLDNFFY